MLKDPRRVAPGCEWPVSLDGWLCEEPIVGRDAHGRWGCEEHLAQDPPLEVVDPSKGSLGEGGKARDERYAEKEQEKQP